MKAMNTYIAFMDGIKVDGELQATAERVEYSFHTFSLRNESMYEPTGDATFASPNDNALELQGGVERLIDAVLHIKTKAIVLKNEEVKEMLDKSPDQNKIGRAHV